MSRRRRKPLQAASRAINNFGRSMATKTRPARKHATNTARQAFDRSRFGRDVHSAHRGKGGRWTQVSSRGHHTKAERRQLHIDATRGRSDEERAEQARRKAEKARGRAERQRAQTERASRPKARPEPARERPAPTRDRGRSA